MASTTGALNGPLDSVTYEPVSPAYGDSVVFEFTGVTEEQVPWVIVKCFQGHEQVYEGRALYYLTMDWKQFVFKLAGDEGAAYRWPGGAASGTAELSVRQNKNHHVVDRLEFEVAA